MTTHLETDPLPERLDALAKQLAWLVDRQRRQDELIDEMMPIAREGVAVATRRLGDLEQRGWFAFGHEVAAVAARIMDHYDAADVRALGDAIVSILDTVRAFTQPEVLEVLAEAAEGLKRADEVDPIGLVGVVRTSRNADVQKGMAVVMELMRHIGRAAKGIADRKRPGDDRAARLAATLGPRRQRKVLGIERTPAPRRLAPHATAPAAPSAASPAEDAPVASVVDGVAFAADGHLADPSLWSRSLAQNIATGQGVTLTPEHWSVIESARAEYERTKVAPNIRRLTQVTGLGTREIYGLFPRTPARTIARIAGTPKPAGCI